MNTENAISQSMLSMDLSLVRNGKHPEKDIPELKTKVKDAILVAKEYSWRRVDTDFKFNKHYYQLPGECFRKFSKEDKIRLKFASFITLHPTLVDKLEMIPEFEIIDKLLNSQWRYGYGQDWNTAVRAYEGMRRFEFGDDFEVRIDITTGCNHLGFSRYERVFLDGTCGFLIYHKGKHVLTIGFSFADKNRVLIQQVQLKNKKGNRFLYKLPCNVLDYAIEKMRDAFSGMSLYLCQADDQIKRIKESYEHHPEKGKEFETNDAYRLKKFYSKRLRKFNRRPSRTKFHGVRFRKLVEKAG